MKWFEYQMEVDQLHAPDELKARLLAMQPDTPNPMSIPKAPPRPKMAGQSVSPIGGGGRRASRPARR